jgi:hypothetical protein
VFTIVINRVVNLADFIFFILTLRSEMEILYHFEARKRGANFFFQVLIVFIEIIIVNC